MSKEAEAEHGAHREPLAPAMDMHVHSEYSDAKISVADLEEVARRRRLGISVCDHNEIRGSIQLWERGVVVTLPAIEIGSVERLEFLCYFPYPQNLEDFYVKHVEPFKRHRFYALLDAPFTRLIPAAKDHGAIICLPHPFAPGWKNFNFNRRRKAQLLAADFMDQVDLIEVINGHLPDNRNFKAFMLSEILEKSVSAGSDAHHINEVGNAYLSFGRLLTGDEIFRILKSRIKVGATSRFNIGRTMNTSRRVILNHIKLYLSKKNQARWMLPYDDEPYDPDTMPDRRSGFDRPRYRGPERRRRQ